MFDTHQPIISKWALDHETHMARVLQFSLTSARVKFINMPATLDEAMEGRPGILYGHKLAAWQAAWHDRHENYYQVCDIIHGTLPDHMKPNYLLMYLSQLPGMGLVKGGFACQMLAGMSGCIDTVNAAHFNILGSTFSEYRYRTKRLRTLAGKLGACSWYNDKIDKLGGTEYLWDRWCNEMAERYPVQFDIGEDVSKHHLTCLRVFPEGESL